MPQLPDFNDPRYLDEVGWFLSFEKHSYENTGESYSKDRMDWSGLFLMDLMTTCHQTADWIRDKAVVSIGCGCSGDLAAWPAASKIAIDPLAYAYQDLGMLIEDRPTTVPTTYLSVGIENLPLLDHCADVVVCRNALDHMDDPAVGLAEIRRMLKPEGRLFLWVDIGGEPTPDEPSPFTRASLMHLLEQEFEVLSLDDNHKPHSARREYSVRVLAKRKAGSSRRKLDKERLLKAYQSSIEEKRP